MRLFILMMGLMVFFSAPVMAQEVNHFDTCTAAEENFIVQTGGPGRGGVHEIFVCNGSRWIQGVEINTLSGEHNFFGQNASRLTLWNRGNGSNHNAELIFRSSNQVTARIRHDFDSGPPRNADLVFMTAQDSLDPTEKVRIKNNGNVGIGTDVPDVELDVNGSIEFTGTIRDMSDRSQKTDIRVLTDALSAVSKINGVSFKMKDSDGLTELGLIAQDVEAVYPELVYTNDDGIKALNYQGMIGPLVEAVKELNAQNAVLRAELEAKDSELARMIHEISNRMDVLEGKRRPPLKPYNQ